ncbi:hypothetical protein G5I_13499 [Acromyrmex echinatior]|uniref:Uncharacterized protein n=1 Tax=Acromyrmex echinatior TaxID=103372 RepID=F4X574_ACREC|nr:hypothetical protein G5I_13499 [Acromyrmex echinatior]
MFRERRMKGTKEEDSERGQQQLVRAGDKRGVVEVRHRIRLRGQDAGDRMRRGKTDPLDTGELWQVLHHDMQRAREHRVERQLHVAQIVPRAEQRMHMELYVMEKEHLKKNLTRKHFQNSLTKRPSIELFFVFVVVDLYPYEVRLTIEYWGEQDYTIRHIFLINDGSIRKKIAGSGQGLNKMEQNNVCCHGSFLFLLPPGMPRRDAPVLCLSALLFGYPLCKPAQNLVY